MIVVIAASDYCTNTTSAKNLTTPAAYRVQLTAPGTQLTFIDHIHTCIQITQATIKKTLID